MPSINPKLLESNYGKDILNFFSFLDDYLLKDLESLNKLKGQESGKCYYPMVMTIISGMDLLGTFPYGKRSAGKECLQKFFDKYLCEYKHVTAIFYELVRNGSAHYYLVKKGICIRRSMNDLHLKRYKNQFYIDLDCLYKDFLKAYKHAKTDIIDNITNEDGTYKKGYDELQFSIKADDKFDNGILNKAEQCCFQNPVLDIDLNTGLSQTYLPFDDNVKIINKNK